MNKKVKRILYFSGFAGFTSKKPGTLLLTTN